jgi:signal transduction histidine kinase
VQQAVTLPATLSKTFSNNASQNTQVHSTETVLGQLIHDLRQPLSAIENHAFVLQMSATDGAICSHLEAIQDSVEQAHYILELLSGAANTISLR